VQPAVGGEVEGGDEHHGGPLRPITADQAGEVEVFANGHAVSTIDDQIGAPWGEPVLQSRDQMLFRVRRFRPVRSENDRDIPGLVALFPDGSGHHGRAAGGDRAERLDELGRVFYPEHLFRQDDELGSSGGQALHPGQVSRQQLLALGAAQGEAVVALLQRDQADISFLLAFAGICQVPASGCQHERQQARGGRS